MWPKCAGKEERDPNKRYDGDMRREREGLLLGGLSGFPENQIDEQLGEEEEEQRWLKRLTDFKVKEGKGGEGK